MLQELRQDRGACLPRRHRSILDDRLAERPEQPLRDADEAGGGEYDEGHEQEAEPEQPVPISRDRPARSRDSPEDDEEERAEGRSEERAHPADHHHGEELAGEGDGDGLRRRHAVIEEQQGAGQSRDRRGHHEGDELVAVRRIATNLARCSFSRMATSTVPDG